ncbi:MAG: GC-type dockerin domain-anchored protein [Phycisphaerales bacterium]
MRRILVAIVLTPVASAEIVSVAGQVERVDAPPSVRRQAYESVLARVFLERADITIPQGQTINAVNSGVYDCYCDFEDEPLAESVVADTYFFHFDPPGTSQHFAQGEIEFSRPIVGVLGRSLTMHDTDATFGRPGTLYPTDRFNREFEFQNRGNYDYFEISSDRRRISFRVVCSTDVDQFRVILGSGCRADLNGDGAVDTQDVVGFLAAWSAGEPAADTTADGVIDSRDFAEALHVWSGGC